MKITFKTITAPYPAYDRDFEVHQVFVDKECLLSANNRIPPEDVEFFRELVSPFQSKKIIQLAYEAGKKGEELIFETSECDEKDDPEWWKR